MDRHKRARDLTGNGRDADRTESLRRIADALEAMAYPPSFIPPQPGQIKTVTALEVETINAMVGNPGWKFLATGKDPETGVTTITFGWAME